MQRKNSAETHAAGEAGKRRQLQSIQRLLVDRHYRDTQQLFVIEGVRNVLAAAANGFEFRTIVRSQKLLRSAVVRETVEEKLRTGTPMLETSPEAFRSISTSKRASGIAAVVCQQRARFNKTEVHPGDIWIGLSEARSTGNIGSLIRTASATKVAGVILIGQSIDQHDPSLIRASMGAFFRIPFLRASWDSFAAWQGRHSVNVIGACPSANVSFREADYSRPTVIMLGEERRGLSSRQRLHCKSFVHIPMDSETDSLNLAVAGSLLLYEAARAAADTS